MGDRTQTKLAPNIAHDLKFILSETRIATTMYRQFTASFCQLCCTSAFTFFILAVLIVFQLVSSYSVRDIWNRIERLSMAVVRQLQHMESFRCYPEHFYSLLPDAGTSQLTPLHVTLLLPVLVLETSPTYRYVWIHLEQLYVTAAQHLRHMYLLCDAPVRFCQLSPDPGKTLFASIPFRLFTHWTSSASLVKWLVTSKGPLAVPQWNYSDCDLLLPRDTEWLQFPAVQYHLWRTPAELGINSRNRPRSLIRDTFAHHSVHMGYQ